MRLAFVIINSLGKCALEVFIYDGKGISLYYRVNLWCLSPSKSAYLQVAVKSLE